MLSDNNLSYTKENLNDYLKELAKEYHRISKMLDTVARLFEAEINVLKTWTIEEVDTHISLTKKFISSFKEQTEAL